MAVYHRGPLGAGGGVVPAERLRRLPHAGHRAGILGANS